MQALLRLAIPIALSYLGIMVMGLVDLIAVGRVGIVATGAVGLGTSIFAWFLVLGTGLLSGMDFFVASSFGGGRREDCGVTLVAGLKLAWLVSAVLTALLAGLSAHLSWFGVDPLVEAATRAYLGVLLWSLPPVLVFAAYRNFVQAVGNATAPMITLGVANVLNALLNYALVFGHFGLPRWGLVGSAWATLISRVWMAIALWAFAKRESRRQRIPIAWSLPTRARLREILRLGGPSAGQLTLEVGVFTVATTIAAKLAPVSLAAHQIVLNTASVTFMVPMGIGAATAVLVGQCVGRAAWGDAVSAGRNGLWFGVVFMLFSAAVLVFGCDTILSAYTGDPGVVEVARGLVIVAACFQVSDGVQVVATGALRGIADTRTSMFANLIGHWFIGLPLGVYLCFPRAMGIRGLWMGLATGLTLVAIALTLRWFLGERKLRGPWAPPNSHPT